MSFTALSAGGCFTVSPSENSDSEISDFSAPEGLKEIHAWSCRRDGLMCDAARILSVPMSAMKLGAPKRAECIIIEGASHPERPIQSITRVEFEKGVKLFWYDGLARPEIGLPVLPPTGCYLLGKTEGRFFASSASSNCAEDLDALLALIIMARGTPGHYVTP